MDPIADLLIRIKNAQSTGCELVELPFSKVKFAVSKILEKEGFLAKVEKRVSKNKEKLELKLKYNEKMPAIQNLKRVSKSGQRVYIKSEKIRPVRQGYGLVIISTSQGLMTGKEARKKRLGGEIICEIW